MDKYKELIKTNLKNALVALDENEAFKKLNDAGRFKNDLPTKITININPDNTIEVEGASVTPFNLKHSTLKFNIDGQSSCSYSLHD
ncbi:hypothetical protein [Lactobacillus mulieris]|jgi:hypothetical protein|uniref:Uncharacterized protein n=2 Tax=root TaxID=1 RepID=A0ABT4JZW1_9LACO|nr:hypothetical protein [Lactobacillus mulieris]EEU21652.1 hypothetical protein HMPREF0525_00586 [Lactobacillus jensenii 27-2-CHN]EEX24521.1 hypothetical protein HMPREF0974_00326 [Lactobacillus jensenii 115-3-CHN]DAD80394.1 MAG TPA: hypothetical protein [Siphoviridae sp. ctX581]MCW8093494.1 hypothetical protein [Lactobacillus mulieris]MCW8106124.1 hypothetical protein [Lactobacillus mulieris]